MSTPTAPNATAAAVDVRSTVGPSRTATAPASVSAASSSGAIPPSGPTTSINEPACAAAISTIRSVASSCRTSTAAPAATSSRTRCTSIGVDNTPSTGGMRARRDCRAAERTTARHRRKPLSTRAPSQFATQRAACHARNASAPASVASSIANSERSDLGSACTTVTGGRTGGTLQRLSTRARSPPRPACSTTQRARRPTPSPSTNCSPGRIRRTVAA
ncbi:Uncharacterised protein [Mycobacterium tuberculosis]|nr:Uncharacterised protein [Mycobacterium tuberculosis]